MKRGMSEVVGGLIIFAVVILIGTILVIKFGKLFGEQTSDTCAAQVKAHSAVVSATKEDIALDIKCPTHVVHLDSGQSDGEINGAVADEMAQCWRTWGEGKLKLFEQTQGVYCHICSTVSFTGEKREVKGLTDYLQAEKISWKKEMTYASYLSGVQSGAKFEGQGAAAAGTYSFSTEQPQAVIFYYAKGNVGFDRFKNSFMSSPGGKTSMVVGGLVVAGVLMWVACPFTAGVTCAIATGISATAGGIAGGIASVQAKSDSDYMTFVAYRPLTGEQIKSMGCQYAPVKQS